MMYAKGIHGKADKYTKALKGIVKKYQLKKKKKTMEKIELTNDEIKIIEKQLSGKLTAFNATEEEQIVMCSVVDKAEALMHELKAYEESGDDLIKWFYNIYKQQ